MPTIQALVGLITVGLLEYVSILAVM
jgi:hypothetical protein